LQLIYDRKLIRRDHLEIISESYRHTGANRTRLLNKSLKKMYQSMCIDKIHEKQEIGKGNNPSIVGVDKGGSILLGVAHKKRIAHKKTIFKGNEYIVRSLPINFRHINGVNQIEIDTILFCDKYDFKILMWDLEKPKSFMYNQERITLIPDITMILSVKGEPFVAFIEFDTGSEGLRQKEPAVIRDKIIKYKMYKKTNLWMREEWQKQFTNPVFPLLMFVTEDDKRVCFFNRKSKELGVKALGMYSENYTKVIERIITLI
jgi:hypothetical protein